MNINRKIYLILWATSTVVATIGAIIRLLSYYKKKTNDVWNKYNLYNKHNKYNNLNVK
jgi:hypothetical protein